MPTKRSAVAMRLAELSFRERLSFLGCWWRPGRHAEIRWCTWDEYFAMYELVREELLEEQREQGRGWPPFAEQARAFFLARKDPAEAVDAYEAGLETYSRRRHGEHQATHHGRPSNARQHAENLK